MEKIRIGIIGAGGRGILSFGKIFSGRKDCRLVALADLNPVRMQAARQLLGGTAPEMYPNHQEMLKKAAIDVVVVTSPDCFHKEHILAALEAGKHVLTDKPMATKTADCLAIARKARKTSRTVDMGFNLRHDPVCKKIKEIVSSGMLGQVILIDNRDYYDGGRSYMARWNRLYAKSGGLFCHKGSHDFDLLNWLNAGALPVKVSAFAGVNVLKPEGLPFPLKRGEKAGPYCEICQVSYKCKDRLDSMRDYLAPEGADMFRGKARETDHYHRDTCIYLSEKDTHDNGIAIVEYDNGVRASHWECFVTPVSTRRFTIVGDRGHLDADLERNRITVHPRWSTDTVDFAIGRQEGGHGGADPSMVEKFVENLRSGNKPCASVRDGTLSVVIAEAAERSRREGRTVFIKELLSKKDLAELD